MPYDGSGNFNRTFPPGGWQGDATANIKIRADRHDQHDGDIASGLSNAICKDGQSSVTADIPFNGKKIINLGAPVNPNDAATKAYADIAKPSTTGLVISGADALGRLSFTSPTGANGLSFTGADLSWLAKLATAAGPGTPPVPPATINRLVLNDKADGTGTDVVEVRDDGSIKAGAIEAASLTTTGAVTATGAITASGNITGAGVTAVAGVFAGASAIYLRPNGVNNAAGQVVIDSAGNFYAPTGASFPGNVTVNSLVSNGALNVAGTITTAGLQVNAGMLAYGYRTRSGVNGGWQGSNFNFFWGGTYIDIYIDATPFRLMSGLSDYRIKKDVQALQSTWDKVKALRPISYSTRDYGELFKGNDEIQWGFIAHELQETLLPSAAVGEQDGERIQQVDLAPVVASLTKALQEAMARIEVLEGKL